MIYDTWYNRSLVRFCMVCIVVCGIGLFLYSPNLFHAFYVPKSINILVWPNVIDAEYLEEFEEKTGIKVHVNYFETNEELFVKIRASEGSGYDLIMPSDYAADLMIQENLLQPLDWSRLNFFNRLYPALLNRYFDPGNKYTIPWYWDLYGLGIHTAAFGGQTPEISWGLVFDPHKVRGKVGMFDDGREIILIAAQYLFGSIDALHDSANREIIAELLRQQKNWVEMYTEMRSAYLLGAQIASVSTLVMTDVPRLLSEYPDIKFGIPKEGSFAIIDSFALPKGSTKQEYAYAFLNYVYSAAINQQYVDKYKMSSPLIDVRVDHLFPEYAIPTQDLFSKLDFFRNVIDDYSLHQLWVKIIS
jgi:spermidine/putrescine transport system substrate-binding protein